MKKNKILSEKCQQYTFSNTADQQVSELMGNEYIFQGGGRGWLGGAFLSKLLLPHFWNRPPLKGNICSPWEENLYFEGWPPFRGNGVQEKSHRIVSLVTVVVNLSFVSRPHNTTYWHLNHTCKHCHDLFLSKNSKKTHSRIDWFLEEQSVRWTGIVHLKPCQ